MHSRSRRFFSPPAIPAKRPRPRRSRSPSPRSSNTPRHRASSSTARWPGSTMWHRRQTPCAMPPTASPRLEQLGFARRLGRPHRGGLRGTRAQHGRIRPLRQRQPVRHVVRTGHRVGVAGRQRGRSAQRYVVRTAGQRIRQRRNDPRLQDHLYPPRGGGRPGSLE